MNITGQLPLLMYSRSLSLVLKMLKSLYFPFFMALFMSGLMSLQMLLIRDGYSPDLWHHWLSSWPLAFAVAFPSAVIVSPLIRKLTSWLSKVS